MTTPQHIIELVAEEFGITREQLCGYSRIRHITIPRFVAYTLLKAHTELSYHDIGQHFSRRDHTTVMHGVKKLSEYVARFDGLGDRIERLEQSAHLALATPFKSVRAA